MAVYKVYLTVKDSYGKEKEVDAGNINVDFSELSETEASTMKNALNLEQYLKKAEIDTELNSYATDLEVAQAVSNTVKYGGFKKKEGVDS